MFVLWNTKKEDWEFFGFSDRWERGKGDYKSQIIKAPQYNSVQGGKYLKWGLIFTIKKSNPVWLLIKEGNSFFLQVVLTPTHLAIVMEYAAGGELFERICNAGRFSEDEVKSLSLSLIPFAIH